MSYYRVCPICGSTLDPGEVCDCIKEAAVNAANNDNGTVKKSLRNDFFTKHNSTNQLEKQDRNGALNRVNEN